jgi:hypothetical protein
MHGRVEYLVELLTQAGVSVQLKFLESKADLVRVLYDGKEIASHPDLQHNRNYYERKPLSEELVNQVMAALKQ